MLQLILAIRYMFKRRIAYLAVLTVTLSVFVALVVLTVMHGLVGDFKESTHQFVGDCVVGTDSLVGFSYYDELMSKLDALPEVEALSPVVQTYGLCTDIGTGYSDGIRVMGIDPNHHDAVTGFAQYLRYRQDRVGHVFRSEEDPNRPGCAMGVDRVLIRDENGNYPYNDMLWIREFDLTCFPLTAKGVLRRSGVGEVSTKRFELTDLVQTDLAEQDGQIMYIDLHEAQQLSGMDLPELRVSAIHIKFADQVRLEQGTEQVREVFNAFRESCTGRPLAYLLESVKVQDWKRYCRSIIAPVEKEQLALMFMFLLVGLTTIFIVLVIFHMIVSHKSKDIGIMRSMGVSSPQVMGLYWLFALLIGIQGAAFGLIGGWLFLRYINVIELWLFETFQFQLFNRAMFAVGELPHDVTASMVISIGLFAVLSCLIGALIPAWQAARLQPVKSLQVNQL